jgi:hypothetical protein
MVFAWDPEALSRWCAEHLGVTPPPPTYEIGPELFQWVELIASEVRRSA